MALVIGVPGRDAVWKSHEELAKAASALQRMLRSSHRYDEADISEIRDMVQQPERWLTGAEGECRTAKALERLPDDYVVFHDFHVRQLNGNRSLGNVDHIVVGPTGVFVIDTKNHRRTASVRPAKESSRTRDHMRVVRRQAMQVRSWLKPLVLGTSSSVYVQAVVVHVHGRTIVEKTEEEHVWFLPLDMLLSRIKNRSPRLKPADVAAISKTLTQKRALTPADALH